MMEIIGNTYQGYPWRCETGRKAPYQLKLWCPNGKPLVDKPLQEEPRIDAITGWLLAAVKFHQYLKGE